MNLIETTNYEEYRKAGGDPWSCENQDILNKLVYKYVGSCVSQLVSFLQRIYSVVEEHDVDYAEALNEITETVDYQEAAEDECWVEKCEYDDDELIISQFYNTSTKDTSTAEDWEDLCYEQNIEPYRCKVYEHWIVSDWFADRLREHRHRVRDVFGLTIWGRPTTGQAIMLDHVITEIAAEMQILVGQKYDWSK